MVRRNARGRADSLGEHRKESLARRKRLAPTLDYLQAGLPSAGESRLQLVESPRPSSLVGTARLLVAQQRMGERELRALGNEPQHDLHARLVRVLFAALPAPAHHHAFRSYDLEKFPAAFVFRAVEQTEPHPIAAALARLGP